MKKSVLALSMSVFLSACGGSDGDSDITEKPQPTTPQETIDSIVSNMGFNEAQVKAVCNDAAFECAVLDNDETRTSLATVIHDKSGLVGFGSYSDGPFWNDAEIVVANSKAININEHKNAKGKAVLTLFVDGVVFDEYMLTDLEVEQADADNETLSVNLQNFVDVYSVNMSSVLNALIKQGSEVKLNSEVVVENNNVLLAHEVKSFDISSAGYKAAFSMLLEKNDELYSIDAGIINKVPMLSVNGSLTGLKGTTQILELDIIDPDGDTFDVIIDAPEFVKLTSNNVITLYLDGVEGGSYPISIAVIDAQGAKVTKDLVYKVVIDATDILPPNQAPSIELEGYEPNHTVYADKATTFNVITSDPEGDAVSVCLQDDLDFASLDNGILTLKPTAKHIGSHTLGISVSDENSGVMVGFPINVVLAATDLLPSEQVPTAPCGDNGECLEDDGFTNPDLPLTPVLPPSNSAPYFATDMIETFVEFGAHNYVSITAVDPDGDEITYSLKDAPGWAVISEDPNGMLLVFDRPLESGLFSIQVHATDGKQTAILTVVVTVGPENQAPEFVRPLEDVTLVQGETVYASALAVDAEGDLIEYTLSGISGVDEWISIDVVTAEIEIKPTLDTQAGEYIFYVDARADSGAQGSNHDTDTFSVTVVEYTDPLEELAALIGEPVEKLQVLFNSGSGLSWKKDALGNPVIDFAQVHTKMSFNLGTKRMSAYNADFRDAINTFTHVSDMKRVLIGGYSSDMNNPYEGYEIEFTQELIELENYYGNQQIMHGAVSFDYTPEILNDIILGGLSQDAVMMIVDVTKREGANFDEVVQEWELASSLGHLDEAYRGYLLHILTK